MVEKGVTMKRSFALGLVLLSTAAWSQDLCEVNANTPIQRFGLDRIPNYFISADPNGRYVGVIGNGNHIYDMTSGSPPKSVQVPGSYDPVFTPDGRYVTVPPGVFYDADAYRDGLASGVTDMSDGDANVVGSSNAATAAYQSVGTLEDGQDKSKYLYISDSMQNNPTADLSFFIGEVDHTTKKMKTVKTGTLCGNIGEAHTPMISNDGKYLSILNPHTRSTQIYRVDLDGGPCKMVTDLGVPTGKVSFDFGTNPRRLAFHVDQSGTNIGWFPQISEGITKDTYVMDLDVVNAGAENETWEMSGIQRLGVAAQSNTGTYYPRWRRDGTVIAITHQGSDKYSIDVFDPNNGTTLNPEKVNLVDPVTTCGLLGAESYAALAIAFLWEDTCNAGVLPLRLRDSLRITPWLNHEACLRLIDQRWDALRTSFATAPQLRDTIVREGKMYEGSTENAGSVADMYCEQVLGMSKEQLKTYCPEARDQVAEVNTVVTVAEVQQDTPQQTFNRQCGGCHSTQDAKGGLAFMNFADGSANTRAYNPTTGQSGLTSATAEQALNAFLNPNTMASARMPPPGAAGVDAIKKRQMAEYLLQFVQPESRRQKYINMAENL
jgi:hypothetical protein